MKGLYVKLFTTILDNDELLESSAEARWVLVASLAQARRAVTPGEVSIRPARRMERWAGPIEDPEGVIARLVEIGVWEDHGSTALIVNWHRYQDELRAERRDTAADGAKGGHTRWHNEGRHDGAPKAGCPLCEADTPQLPPIYPLSTPVDTPVDTTLIPRVEESREEKSRSLGSDEPTTATGVWEVVKLALEEALESTGGDLAVAFWDPEDASSLVVDLIDTLVAKHGESVKSKDLRGYLLGQTGGWIVDTCWDEPTQGDFSFARKQAKNGGKALRALFDARLFDADKRHGYVVNEIRGRRAA